MSALAWNPQQAAALDEVGRWFRDPNAPQVFRLFGYAGTGKTTLARHLAENVRFVIFAAYTGKAASVMRENGCAGAMTLHSLLYSVRDRDKTLMNELKTTLDGLAKDHPYYREALAEYEFERDRCKRPSFSLNPDSMLREADLLVVDEVSMVDERVGRDILSFGKKVLVLGDPAQLPPVMGGGFFTNCKPDRLLTEIHRQAEGNPILRWATMARNGEVIPFGDEGAAKKFRSERVHPTWFSLTAGQLLCGKNETRRSLNTKIRAQKGFTGRFPSPGERLVCLANDHAVGVLNGVTCEAISDSDYNADRGDDSFSLSLLYEGKVLPDAEIDASPFLGIEPPIRRKYLSFDFGYALTVHKAQGSQWPTVTLFDDGFGKREPDVRRRWLYTAITRAQHQLHIVTS